ncbi:mitochondrial distribution and morphology protein 31 [Metschnikowia bicuspidata var. bicuspidata NRRL YB-4993]|uniref:Mitochondrial distribution and morphology protein 31 n=1 Tax=Metschnikowia bicuspidata var. bicuspidata NRRL YB-4993 TaxID=869754 RepID=A0A1A0HA03_9ASCO|nr:mitochondrial distribution and morphology protein 31 [Metschnikowia bicuspidata var. bicuspidata NRRL YB-4993]OBA20707.1 mitochondrial distribution and morphology protein 31 [Metschnikowia bicuspidata var. bicuspidata NRRL YB-4993]
MWSSPPLKTTLFAAPRAARPLLGPPARQWQTRPPRPAAPGAARPLSTFRRLFQDENGAKHKHPPQKHTDHPPRQAPAAVTKEQLLARATSVASRAGVRFKWLMKRLNRPLNTDDYSALFSWLVVGNAFLLVAGTTTFVLLVIFTVNPLFSQEFVARKVGELMTQNLRLQVTFEHAIVPGWRDGKISFKKCFVSRRPEATRTFAKGLQADAYARRQAAAGAAEQPEDDGNYTQFDVTIEEINVTLSFRKWMNGTGLVDTMEIAGLRGVVDRTHVHWDPADDATNYKNRYQFGDFELNRFVMRDVLFTLRQPAGFRAFDVAIYNCELDRLRKHWLLYDLLNAASVSGSYDDSLFTIHKRQRLHDFDDARADAHGLLPWKRVTRLRVDSLGVDHLNTGLEGPFGWISSGKVDMVGDVMVPEDARDYNVSEIVAIVAESIHKEATRYRNPAVCASKPSHGSRLRADDMGDVSRFFVLDLTLRLNNVRALVPFPAPELSYVNYALVRPIVAYINLRNAFVEIHSRVVKSIDDFSGSWTVYDSLLMDDISELVYDSFVNYVADDEARLVRMRKMAFWSVQVLVQLIVFGLGALT